MINFYQAQINPVYCSAASAVIILNAINYGEIPNQEANSIIKPDGEIAEYHLFSQNDFFNDQTDKIKKREIILYQESNPQTNSYDPGLNLSDLNKILKKVYHLNSKIFYVKNSEEKEIADFRKKLKKILADDDNFILANFDGKALEKTSSGHISPVVAYDEEDDSVLIMDVALHKNLWFFVSLSKLYKAMNTMDGSNHRGYLIISK